MIALSHRRALAVRGVIVVAVIAAAVAVALRPPAAPPAPSTSTQPTTWRLPRLLGSGTVALHDLRGHPVVVDFFASWCTACRGELPGMAAVSQGLGGRVTFVGVDSLETGDGIAMARQTGITGWDLLRDVGGADQSGLHDAVGPPGMPITAFYDAGGRLVSVAVGALSEDDLRAKLHTLFGIS